MLGESLIRPIFDVKQYYPNFHNQIIYSIISTIKSFYHTHNININKFQSQSLTITIYILLY